MTSVPSGSVTGGFNYNVTYRYTLTVSLIIWEVGPWTWSLRIFCSCSEVGLWNVVIDGICFSVLACHSKSGTMCGPSSTFCKTRRCGCGKKYKANWNVKANDFWLLVFWSFGHLVFWSLGLLVFWSFGLLVLYSFLVFWFFSLLIS